MIPTGDGQVPWGAPAARAPTHSEPPPPSSHPPPPQYPSSNAAAGESSSESSWGGGWNIYTMSSSGERPVQQQLYPPMNAATSQQQQHHRSPVDAGAPAVQQYLLWNSGRTAPPSEEGEEKVVDDGPPPGLQGKYRVESSPEGTHTVHYTLSPNPGASSNGVSSAISPQWSSSGASGGGYAVVTPRGVGTTPEQAVDPWIENDPWSRAAGGLNANPGDADREGTRLQEPPRSTQMNPGTIIDMRMRDRIVSTT